MQLNISHSIICFAIVGKTGKTKRLSLKPFIHSDCYRNLGKFIEPGNHKSTNIKVKIETL